MSAFVIQWFFEDRVCVNSGKFIRGIRVTNKYYSPQGGLPPQTQIMTDRAMFTDAYAVIPKGTYSDIVTSFLPFGRVCGCGSLRDLCRDLRKHLAITLLN